MTDPNVPVRGATLTYLDPGSAGGIPFRRAVARGTVISDPHTNDMWIPVLEPPDMVDLIDPALVVEVAPPLCHDSREAHHQVTVLRDALRTTVRALAEVAGQDAEQETRRLLGTVLDMIVPTRRHLLRVATADMVDRFTVVLTYLSNAQDHTNAGDVPAARAALLTAYTAVEQLLTHPAAT